MDHKSAVDGIRPSVDPQQFVYGPTRLYVGRTAAQSVRYALTHHVEVHVSTGEIEALNPLDGEFGWGFSGPATFETAAAILSHALGLQPTNGSYHVRVLRIARAFATEFIGEAHTLDVEHGFTIPGELVLLWVLKNERVLRAEQDQYRGSVVIGRIPRPRVKVLRGSPRTLDDILRGYRRPSTHETC